MSAALPFAILALLPVIVGPPPTENNAIIAKLCNGGTITIPLGDDAPADHGNCHLKGCHAGNCRPKDRPERQKRAI